MEDSADRSAYKSVPDWNPYRRGVAPRCAADLQACGSRDAASPTARRDEMDFGCTVTPI
jgi:hypothetical protein